jgi:hypothetical protein
MPKAFVRKDFLIKDLAVNVGGGSRSGVFLPGPDDETPPSPISPIASVVANLDIIEGVRATVAQAVQDKRYDEIGRAFIAGDTGGNVALRAAIQDIGTAVVAATAYASLGGSAGLPNPDCGGTSLETIPPTLTPVVHVGLAVHRVSELPRLQKQLAAATAYVDKAVAASAPRGAEVATVRTQLEGALKSLSAAAGAKA